MPFMEYYRYCQIDNSYHLSYYTNVKLYCFAWNEI